MENKIIFQTTTKTGKSLTFRYPTIDDLQILTDYINKASAEKTFIRFQGEQTTLEGEKKWLESTIKSIESKKEVYLMAFVDNKLAGTSDIVQDSLTREHRGVFGIIVDSQYRGEGVGESLMQLVISEAKKNLKGLKIIHLECFAPNFIAQNLYKKMGFTEYGRLPGGDKYKGDFVDEILMYKKVK